MPKIPAVAKKPMLTNRGGAGLLNKLPSVAKKPEEAPALTGAIDNILCDGEVVDIDSLIPDPNNARLHPDRNKEAIKESLMTYGQRIALVVRQQDRMIAAGNGRWECAKELGWTKIAVSIRPMTDVEFTGFALADNRSAELAKWDFEVVARLDALLVEQQHMTRPGWSADELEVLRAADWSPPAIEETDGQNGETDSGAMTVVFNEEMADIIRRAVGQVLGRGEETMALSEAEALEIICTEWLGVNGG